MRKLLLTSVLIVNVVAPVWAANPGKGFAQTRLMAQTMRPEPGSGANFDWQTIQIEGPAACTKGLWMSVAVRGQSIHLAYWVCKNSSPVQSVVHYALSTDSGATWTVEAVDTSSNYGSGECYMAWFRGGIDLDTAGQPHVAYTVVAPGTGSFCIHARRMGPGDWRRDTVEFSSNSSLIGYDADLKIDARNRAHIAYPYNGANSRYAVQGPTRWVLYDIPSDSSVGAALALDSGANPHVAIGTIASMHYAYSSDGGSNWLNEAVGPSWWHCDIALGADQEPLIAHSVGTMSTGNVWLSRRTGPGAWTSVQADDGTNNPYRPALYFDRDEALIHIAYYGGSQVKHSWSSDNGQTWTKENVASAYMNSTANVADYVNCDMGKFLPFESPGSAVSVARDLAASAIADAPRQDASSFALCVAPNPLTSAGAATIRYTLPKTGNATLNLFDVTGHLVKALATAKIGTVPVYGTVPDFRLEFNARGLPAGVYVLRLESNSATTIQKLVIE